MNRLQIVGICLGTVCLGLLGLYEFTAKSPQLLGHALPGWQETQQVENHTQWKPPTGILPLDKLLHEGEEALRFYGFFG